MCRESVCPGRAEGGYLYSVCRFFKGAHVRLMGSLLFDGGLTFILWA